MSRVLLTGGRAPAALDLARSFAAAGHTVVMAECLRGHLSFPSNAIARSVRVPAPNDGLDAFADALADLARRESVDLVVPTCEEIFHVARRRERISAAAPVFAEPIERLRALHGKWEFVELARASGLAVPETELVASRDALHDCVAARGAEIVLKPVYSRFASETILAPKPSDAARVHVGPEKPWVAQRLLRGSPVCTWSVAHAGRLTAHAAYGVTFTAGRGAAIVFESAEHAAAEAWVRTFVGAIAFTGQIAFDFIDVPGEGLLAIECNPRATSGVHLFARSPALAASFLDRAAPLLRPASARPSMLSLPMVLAAFTALGSAARLRAACRVLVRNRDAVFDARDPLPFLLQGAGLGVLAARALRLRRGIIAASTADIEWNGAP